jgi:hypothetical protein
MDVYQEMHDVFLGLGWSEVKAATVARMCANNISTYMAWRSRLGLDRSTQSHWPAQYDAQTYLEDGDRRG